MRMSAKGRELLAQREGVRTRAYRDSVGVWTVGIGHTAAAGAPIPKAGMTITRDRALELFAKDLVAYEGAVNRAVSVEITQGQFDALASFCFNIGQRGFTNSTVVRKLNRRDYYGAAKAFMLWVKPPELRKRREGEMKQFLAATETKSPTKKEVRAALKEEGSRTITGVDIGRQALVGGGLSMATAAELASQAHDIKDTIDTGLSTVEQGRDLLGWAIDNWQWVAIFALALLAAYFGWRLWRALKLIELARIDDEDSGVHLGRL